MTTEELEILINSTANLSGFTETSAAAQGLTSSHQELSGALQTSSQWVDQNGQALSRAEQHYAEMQLASGDLKAAEHDLSGEGNAVARMFSAVDSSAGQATGRLSALGGVMGGSGALGMGLGAAIVGLGGLAIAGASIIKNSDANEASQKGLAQAFASQGQNLADYQGQIDSFISQNSKYVSSQYDVKDAFAAGTRAGFDFTETQRVVNDALDLSTAKHISLSDAMEILITSSSGSARGLRDLGISAQDFVDPIKGVTDATAAATKASVDKYNADRALQEWEAAHQDRYKLTSADLMHENDLKLQAKQATDNLKTANDNLATAQAGAKDGTDKFGATLDAVEGKVKNARKNSSDLSQSSDDLKNKWETLSNTTGPNLNNVLGGLEGVLAKDVGGVTDLINALNNQSAWNSIDNFIVGAAGLLKEFTSFLNFGAGHSGGSGPGGTANDSGVAYNPGGPWQAGGPGSSAPPTWVPATTYTGLPGPPLPPGTPAGGPTSRKIDGGMTINNYIQGSGDPRAIASAVNAAIARAYS